MALLLCMIPVISDLPVLAANDDDKDITQAGVEYLVNCQLENGSWYDDFNSTVLATMALNKLKENQAGEQWVQNAKLANNNDMLARKALVAEDAVSIVQDLMKNQNEDGGFGLQSGFESDVWDTMLVLEALAKTATKEMDASILSVVRYLVSQQNVDGGWGYTKQSQSNVMITARIGYAIKLFIDNNKYISKELWDVLNKIETYLGSYEVDFSNEAFVKSCYVAMFTLVVNDNVNTSELMEMLAAVQSEDGPFYEDIQSTAVALLLLKEIDDTYSKKCEISDVQFTADSKEAFSNEDGHVW